MAEGLKRDAGKDRWDLVPWQELRDVVKAITFGAQKYSDDNWKHVQPEKYRAALMRHISSALSGEQRDEESGLLHWAHAGACLLFIMWHERRTEDGARRTAVEEARG